jgi:hypothetical protein
MSPRWSEEERLAAAAHFASLNHVINRFVPEARRQAARDEAMAIALGVLGGCCGPNGDFTQASRWTTPESPPSGSG